MVKGAGLNFDKLPGFTVDPVDANFDWQGVAVLFDGVLGKAVKGVELGDIKEQAVVFLAVDKVALLG